MPTAPVGLLCLLHYCPRLAVTILRYFCQPPAFQSIGPLKGNGQGLFLQVLPTLNTSLCLHLFVLLQVHGPVGWAIPRGIGRLQGAQPHSLSRQDHCACGHLTGERASTAVAVQFTAVLQALLAGVGAQPECHAAY